MVKENLFAPDGEGDDDGLETLRSLIPLQRNTLPESEPVPPPKTRESYIWKDGVERAHRPMDYYLNEVLGQLATNQVVIVQAETGVGKTTRIPQAILDSDPEASIYMTQTRRPAVRMNANYIAKEMKVKPGSTVGWLLRGEDAMTSDKTRLTVMIDQSLTNRIRRERKLPEGYIIIDEAHERTVQIDVLLALIKEYLPNSPKTKILITSATIDTQKFKLFFNTADPIIAQNEQLYPVEVYTSPKGELGYPMIAGEHHTPCAIRAVREEVLKPWASQGLTIPGFKKGDPRILVTSGTVLVLLPGKEDIEATMRAIQHDASNLGVSNRVEVLQCHGQMQRKEQELVEQPVPAGVLRFVCATEIIRSSVTAAQVVGVVDSLQVKRHTTDAHGVTHLGKTAISGAEADQGKGRAGREQPGFYIPISYEREYPRIINRQGHEYWPQPAIQRESLTSIILQIASVGVSIRTLDMLDKPPADKIDLAIIRLQRLGALDAQEAITPLGERLVHLPLEPERAIVLINAEKFKVVPEALIATAVLENEGLQYVPRADEKKATIDESLMLEILAEYIKQETGKHGPLSSARQDAVSTPTPTELLRSLPEWAVSIGDNRYIVDTSFYDFPIKGGVKALAATVWAGFAGEANSDFTAAINAYRAFKAQQRGEKQPGGRRGDNHRDYDRDRRWCETHFINLKKLQLIEVTIQELREEAEGADIDIDGTIFGHREFSSDNLTKALLSGLVDNVAILGDGYYKGPMASVIQISNTSRLKGHPTAILIGGVRKVEFNEGRRKRIIHFADASAEVDPDWFTEVMPQLCRRDILAETMRLDHDSGIVSVKQDTYYGEMKVLQEHVPATGERATAVLAWALVEGKTGLPYEEENKKIASRVKELLKRDRSQVNFDELLYAWYIPRLKSATSVAQIQYLNLDLTEDELSILLGEEYPAFEARILAAKPDEIVLNGVRYPLTYFNGENQSAFVPKPLAPPPLGSSGLGTGATRSLLLGANPTSKPDKYYAALKLPLSVIQTFDWSQIPTLDGYDVELSITDKEYTYTVSLKAGLKVRRSEPESLLSLRKSIEERRLELAWSAFRQQRGLYIPNRPLPPGEVENTVQEMKFELKYQETFPPLPAPEIWDPVTKRLAYPAFIHTYNGSNGVTYWSCEWYKTELEAEAAKQQANQSLKEANDREYERLHFDVMEAKAQSLYQGLETLIATIDFDDPEVYGFTAEEAKNDATSPQSLRGSMVRTKWMTGLVPGYKAQPTTAINTLTPIRERLEQAHAYYLAEGQKVLQLRREKEALTEPKRPPGTLVLIIYRTKTGRILASPVVGLHSSRRPTLEGLAGTQVEELDTELSRKLSEQVLIDSAWDARTFTWYEIPASGRFHYLERTRNGSRIDFEDKFVIADVPPFPGAYVILSDFQQYDPDQIGRATVYPTNYENQTGEHKIAVSLYDITNYLIAEHRKSLPAWLMNRTLDDAVKRDIWYRAQQLYGQLKDSGLIWLTPDQVNDPARVTAQAEAGEHMVIAQNDEIDHLLAQSISFRIQKSFERALLGDTTVPAEPTRDLSQAKSPDQLRRLADNLRRQLGSDHVGMLARLRISMIVDKLEDNTDAESLVDIEQELLEFSRANNLTIPLSSQLEKTSIREAPAPQSPLSQGNEKIRYDLRADEYRSLMALDVTELERIMLKETTEDQAGHWRLAVAALAAKSATGIPLIAERRFKPDKIEAIQKALRKIVTEATTNNRPDIDQIKQEVLAAQRGLELVIYLQTVSALDIVKDYYVQDPHGLADFLAEFTRVLERERITFDNLPPLANLEPLAFQVIDSEFKRHQAETNRYIEVATALPIINEYFNDDPVGLATFKADFIAALDADRKKTGQLPPIDQVELIANQVLDSMMGG